MANHVPAFMLKGYKTAKRDAERVLAEAERLEHDAATDADGELHLDQHAGSEPAPVAPTA